jgi:hypothetical protein
MNFALQRKVRWSKAVLDDHNCPDQIFLGSLDTDFCLLVALAIYLEEWVENGGLQCSLLFSDSHDNNKTASNKIKTNYGNNKNTMVFSSAEFQKNSETGKSTDLGSHSLQKLVLNWARVNGCTLDDIETRG